MAVSDELIRAAEPLARLIHDPATKRKVERAIAEDGQVILDGRDYLPLRSPDGSVWRIRVDNAGTITATKET